MLSHTNNINAQIISVASGTEFNIVAGTTVSAEGLDIIPSSNFSLNTGISKTTSTNNNALFQYLPKVYHFDQSTNSFSGTLNFSYSDDELIGLGFNESDLKIIYYENTWAIDNSSQNDTINNVITSGTFNSKSFDEVVSGICISSTSNLTTKLANQSTLAKNLTPTLQSWTIVPGLDAGDFSLDSNNPQQLTFNPFADFANPNDSDNNNVYLVDVTDGCEVKSLTFIISPYCGNWDQGGDGLTQATAGTSAFQIKQGYPNSQDGVYWINLPNVGPTQIYCIMNSAYDGGGWMLAMKATTGTTFNYDANYWFTNNTLNSTDISRNNGDGKYETMNTFQAKDMMAIWPDIQNIGSESGSIDNLSNWTWLQNNFHGNGSRTSLIDKFSGSQLDYYSSTNGSMTFSGYGSVFSSQGGYSFYGINYSNRPNAKVRWGFAWNNETDENTNDVSGGIGMDAVYGNYSAGDRINCCEINSGINRSARVEVYIR